MAARMSVTNSVWEAIKATERALKQLFKDLPERNLHVMRVDVNAPDPFAPGQRDVFVTLHFRKGPGRLYGSIQAWVLLFSDNHQGIPGEQWFAKRLRIISTSRTGPGTNEAFGFTGDLIHEDFPSEAEFAWAEADKRRIQYARS